MLLTRTTPLPTPSDRYRFGDGPEFALQAGTIGWSIDDLRDPRISALWDAGRYEIIDGVLTRMPAAKFRGGSVVTNLHHVLKRHFASRVTPVACSVEVDIEISATRIVRADGVAIIGTDLAKFETLVFPPPDENWRDNPLTLPPTIVIESLSRGHETHDRVTKRQWYAEMGVPNYWIIDGRRRTLECLKLVGGEYEVAATGAGDAVLEFAALDGLSIALAEVWADDLE